MGQGSTRREFVARMGAIGTALAALAAVPGPLRDVLGDVALADSSDISSSNLAIFVAAVEAVCSFDGVNPPPASINGAPQPSAEDAGNRFAADYRTEYAGFRQIADIVLPIAEQGPRTPPPFGAVSVEDLATYGGRSFSELAIPLRLHFARSWLADHNATPLDPEYAVAGIPDVGTLHRAIVVAAYQLTSFFYYIDPRTWAPAGWGGPWLNRDHRGEDLPFSHADHSIYDVDQGADHATWWQP